MTLEMQNGFLAAKIVNPGEQKTKTGIIIPEGSGPDSDYEVAQLEVVYSELVSPYKEGDIILVQKMLPEDVMIENEDGTRDTLYIVQEDDIRAKVII